MSSHSWTARFSRPIRPGLLTASLLWLFSLSGCLQTMEPLNPARLSVGSPGAQRVSEHVAFLAAPSLAGRQPGTAGNRIAAEFIETQFRAAGLQPLPSLSGYRQPITPEIGDNVIGVIPAAEGLRGRRWILVGAHFDHLGGRYLGADDNASAVAILIETARQTASLKNYSVAFVAFNSEESPFFSTPTMGSEWFVRHLPPEIGEPANIQSAVIMDLMGGVQWEPLKETVFAMGAEKSPGLYRRLKDVISRETSTGQREGGKNPARSERPPSNSVLLARFTPHAPRLTVLPVGIHLVEEIPGRGHESFSDYDVFRHHRVPFLFLSTARTPRYHTPADRAETLHYERMAATADWLSRLIAGFDQDGAPYTFEANRVEFGDEVESFRRILNAATNERTLIPGTSRWSLWKLRREREWLQSEGASSPSPQNLEKLERISIRFQCLFADYLGCFMF